MNLNYNGLRDPHLNIFYSYGEKAHLENNITKAFVNTLESFSDDELKIVVKELFDFELPNGKYKTTFYLQKKPSEKMVSKYKKRIMFAFSPTGKSWGIEGLDTKDKKTIKKELEEETKKLQLVDDEKKRFVEFSLEEILKIRENRGSIPDGWLFIDVNDEPVVVVAMENKLYDLDPFQLNNHIEKSLLIVEEADKPKPIYRTYERILDLFGKFNSLLCNQFIEYLTILGYTEVNDFSLACRTDESIRQRLVREFGEDILNMVHNGEKNFRNWETARCHVSYDYLREINLSFRYEDIELWLSFGSTQNSARKMLSKIDILNISDERFESSRGFHLQRGGGSGAPNINDSYILGSWSLKKYIRYWKNNIDAIKSSSIDETISLINSLYGMGGVKKSDIEKIVQRLNRYNREKSTIYIVPEISLVFKWTYEEAAQLGKERFATVLKEKLDLALRAMKLK